MITRSFLTGLGLCTLLSAGALGQTRTIATRNFANPVSDQAGNPLTAGGSANGDGAVLQIGWFNTPNGTGGYRTDVSTFDADDWSAFVPMTGLDSLNPHILTSVGDEDSGAVGDFGLFAFPVSLDTATDDGFPTLTYPVRVGIRIYNTDTVIDGVSEYNTVSSNVDSHGSPSPNDTGWLMNQPVSPSSPTDRSFLFIDGDALYWQSETVLGTGVGTFETALTWVPEPSQALLTLLGGVIVFLRRRR